MKSASGYDLNAIYDLYNNPENAVFFRHFDLFMSLEEFTNSLVLSGKLISFEDGFALIKSFPRSGIFDLSLFMLDSSRRKGLALNKGVELCRLLFTQYRARKVSMSVSADDQRTCDIVEKAGFDLECVLKDFSFYGHCYHNENRYVLTAAEFFNIYGG